LKIDVEGFEVYAIQSALQLISNYNVQNILVEWFPGRWTSNHNVEMGTEILEQLGNLGYEVVHYNLRMALPKHELVEESIPDVGTSWKLSQDQLKRINEWLGHKGEANFWIRKIRPK